MNRNHFWKLCIILFVLVWSVIEIYPPTSEDLIEYFRTNAKNGDAALKQIVEQAKAKEGGKAHAYDSLLSAISTNDIVHYFPAHAQEALKKPHPTTYILHQ